MPTVECALHWECGARRVATSHDLLQTQGGEGQLALSPVGL